MPKPKTEYKYHRVHYSDGTQGSLRIKKGRLASPEFWAAVNAAEATGAAYCGFGNHPADPAEMVTRFQCRACAAERMDRKRFTTYRQPKARQSLDDIRGGQPAAYAPGRYVNNPAAQAEAWHQYRAEDRAREARRAEALELWHEIESAEIPHTATDVKDEPESAPYAMYDDETAARMAALRKELGIE